ncbi:RHS repeat domain-containing protein, partial [Pseudomonas amygdali]
DKLRGETQYEYEANGQLLARNTGRVVDGEEFRYDAAANRLNFNTSRFDHVKDNRLKQWANHEYKYDAWGNLIEKVVGIVRWQTFTYDCENRLVKTETMADTQVESTSSYQYDSLGRRVAKQSDIKGHTDHKRFLWQGLRMLREESPGQSSLYIYEPGSYAPLARVDEKEGEVENKVYYFHTDQIGTPLEMTDAEGQIVWQAKYRAWGAVEKLVVNEVEQNLRFQGQYFDVETGLHYNTFRYYDPEIGRFITQDPIGLLGGSNLYRYAKNSSGWIDPLGLSPLALPAPTALDAWGSGAKLESMPVPKGGIIVEMAMSPGQTRPGGWATLDHIPNVDYVRNELAVIPEFKPEISHVQRFYIPEGVQIQVGPVGPQTSGGKIYRGGGSQIQVLNYADRAKMRPIGKPRAIHSIGCGG